MDSMQMEALRRAQEMHRSGSVQQATNQRSSPQRTKPQPESKGNTSAPSAEKPAASTARSAPDTPKAPLLSAEGIFEDKEKLLILLLIMLLWSEGSADPSVILALLYIII